MTWLSYSTKALSLFGVLPLVLKQFSASEIVLWYLFVTIISLQTVIDFGFRQTFSRIISYAYGGSNSIGKFINAQQSSLNENIGEPNRLLLSQIVGTMKRIYLWLILLVFIVSAIFGSWALIKPIDSAGNTINAWICWIVIVVVTTISFYSKIYLNFLEGLFKIASVRRVETLTSIGSIISSIIVLIVSPSLINLVVTNQIWVLVVSYRDWYLCRKVENGLYQSISKEAKFNKELFSQIWPASWKSGISVLMSMGLVNFTGIVYAQMGNSISVASYLLTLRILNQVRDISMAPFYSKIPFLAILRVKNELPLLISTIKRGMFLSHMVFVVLYILLGFGIELILPTLGSEQNILDKKMWILMGLAFYIHRFGAMHAQVYLSTNHVITHIADGVTGVIYLVFLTILIQYLGVYGIPISMIIGYLSFYVWYSAKYSYSSLGIKFYEFERKAFLFPTVILICYYLFEFLFDTY
jgi:hypothetical protein